MSSSHSLAGAKPNDTWLHRWIFYLAAGFMFAATVLRSLIVYGSTPILISFVLTWLVMFVVGSLLYPRFPKFTLVLVILQTVLVLALLVWTEAELREEIGWPELVETVTHIYAALPADEKVLTTIFADNYGEAGALNLYGPAFGLPEAVSGMNSYWLRGYGNPAAQTVILLGGNEAEAEAIFDTCRRAGRVTNRYGVLNEETRLHPVILLCRGPHQAWPDIWKFVQRFG